MPNDESVQQLVAKVFSCCHELSLRTGRPISPDGHLVGSLGEVIAAERLNLRLMAPSNHGFDAIGPAGERVEIKTTARSSIQISNDGTLAERFVIVQLEASGAAHIVFDGQADDVLAVAGSPQKNGQRRVSLGRLPQNTTAIYQ